MEWRLQNTGPGGPLSMRITSLRPVFRRLGIALGPAQFRSAGTSAHSRCGLVVSHPRGNMQGVRFHPETGPVVPLPRRLPSRTGIALRRQEIAALGPGARNAEHVDALPGPSGMLGSDQGSSVKFQKGLCKVSARCRALHLEQAHCIRDSAHRRPRAVGVTDCPPTKPKLPFR